MQTAAHPPTLPASRPGTPCQDCGRRHRSWYAVAECRWRKALWIRGDPRPWGPCYAVVSECDPGCTVTLWPTVAEAESSKALIDRLACGGGCYKAHRLYQLSER